MSNDTNTDTDTNAEFSIDELLSIIEVMTFRRLNTTVLAVQLDSHVRITQSNPGQYSRDERLGDLGTTVALALCYMSKMEATPEEIADAILEGINTL